MKTKKRQFPNPIPDNACAPCAADQYGWTAFWVRPSTMCYHHHRLWVMETAS